DMRGRRGNGKTHPAQETRRDAPNPHPVAVLDLVLHGRICLRGGLSRCRRRTLEIAAAVPGSSARNQASFNRMSWRGALQTSVGVADEATCPSRLAQEVLMSDLLYLSEAAGR